MIIGDGHWIGIGGNGVRELDSRLFYGASEVWDTELRTIRLDRASDAITAWTVELCWVSRGFGQMIFRQLDS